MDILIKGMDLPKNGVYTFHFASDENGENTNALIINNLTGTIVANEGVLEIPTPHGRLIDANKLEAMMYHEAFEIDSDMQKWDSGCWIRYKVFENCMNRLLPDTILGTEE